MTIFKNPLFLVPALMLLSACGGGGGCVPSDGRPLDTTTDTSENCANTGAPANIAITYPSVSAIEHLTDAGGLKTGVYSLSGSVVVTDKNGNAVADDTIVQLDVIDSIMAQGTIGAGDSITASSFTDTNPTITDDAGIGAADFTTAHVSEGGSSFFIDSQSMVMIIDAADRQDQARFVSSTIANSITVTSPYNSTYPNTSYPSGSTDYIVGRTTVGMKIVGIDPDTGDKTEGVGKTKNGIASFRLEYPANDDTMSIGCGTVPANDIRFPTLNTRDTWVRATAGSDAITIVNDDACFAHILPETFIPSAIVIPSGDSFTLRFVDAEGVSIPFATIPALGVDVFAGGGVLAGGTDCVTDRYGYCNVTVTGDQTDTITYYTPDAGGTPAVFTIPTL